MIKPEAKVCYKCGEWIGDVTEDFIKTFEKEGSERGIDYIIDYSEKCKECQWWDEMDDNRRLEELKNNYDSDYGDWKN